MNSFIFVGILQVLKFEFLKFRIWEILNFHPLYVLSDFEGEEKPEVQPEIKKPVKDMAPRMKTRNKMSNPGIYSYVSY